jgi:Ni,Fe-hydrogenase III large subunit
MNADGFNRLNVTRAEWEDCARRLASGAFDLVSLWHDAGRMHMALSAPSEKSRLIVSVETDGGSYQSVGRYHAPAIRLERAMRDLYGTMPEGLEDRRPWLDHGAWPSRSRDVPPYAFLAADGEGLHQIPVGPVHAGIIEPGHFRFTANGEAVVRLEERLGYVHKGIEQLCAGASIPDAARIASRISGDSTVAYAYAFALAVEAAAGCKVPRRASLLRGIMAEFERIAHHVNDIGAICNDASVVMLHARCALLRERVLQTSKQCFGHRLMMDRIVPGGVAADLSAEGAAAIEAMLADLSVEFERVMAVYDESPSLQDRTVTTGRVSAELVSQFAAGGFVGRASGRPFDTRAVFPYAPYDGLDVRPVLRHEGDVDARLGVRAEELRISVDLITRMIALLEPGPIAASLPKLSSCAGAAMVEAFRGDVFINLRISGDGAVEHLHARDASWFQWPLLEAAIEGNIVADFPLCNKSFNCSYSGHDI